jgi:hypothetical protein
MRASLWRRGGGDLLAAIFGSGWNRESGGRVPGGGGAAGTKRRLGLRAAEGGLKQRREHGRPSHRSGGARGSDQMHAVQTRKTT